MNPSALFLLSLLPVAIVFLLLVVLGQSAKSPMLVAYIATALTA